MVTTLPTASCTQAAHDANGGACYYCCHRCNYDQHICHFCGANLTHDSFETFGGEKRRHWLSDCRPDLIDGTYDGTKAKDGPMTS